MSELFLGFWVLVSVDFGGFYFGGNYCLVVIDDYFRFFVVEIVSSTFVRIVIFVLDKIFVTYG